MGASPSRRSPRRPTVYIVAALACAALSCSKSQPAEPARPRFNVILISIDTLRADRLSGYGYARPTSPAIDRLAGRGARFARAIAESSWTLPSHMTLMTGLAPSGHGVTTRDRALSDKVPLIAEILRDAGYRTDAFTAGGLVGATWGFGRGFETYEDRDRTPLGSVLSRARERIAGFAPSTRYFLFLHTYDVHAPYDPPERYALMFRTRPQADQLDPKLIGEKLSEMRLTPGQMHFISDQYDAGIRAVDDQLGEFFAWLEQRRAFDDTIVILVSDHGEELGEHGTFGHGITLSIQVVHIPLIIVAPGIAPRVVSAGAGLADVLPTVLDLLHLSGPAVQGRSLVPSMQSQVADAADRPLFSELDQQARLRSIVQGRHHLIANLSNPDGARVFDLETDPVERHPLARAANGLGLEQALAEHLASLGPRQPALQQSIGPAVAERLRALGYGDEPEPPKPAGALVDAARAGDSVAVAALLDGGASVNGRGAGGESALIAAAAHGHADTVALLLSRNADINAVDDLDTSALTSAAEQGHAAIVKLLLDHGAPVNASGAASLIAAAAKGHASVVKLLLDAGADRNARDQTGASALQHAAANGCINEVALLLASGADANAADRQGVTPLIAAASSGNREIADRLLAHGAAVNAKSRGGRTALIAAATLGDSALVSTLFAHGADTNASLENGGTALIEALGAGKGDTAKALIAAGADINAKGADGSTALLAATAEESVELVEYLLARGADVTAKIDGSTALHMAVEDGNEKLVEVLLAHGADPEEPNEIDETALEAAADLDSPSITRLLRAAVKTRHRN